MSSGSSSKTLHPVLSTLLGLSILAVFLAIDWLIFRALDTNYFLWYLANGALIGIVVSFLALVWDGLETREDLLAAHPLVYTAGCLTLLAVLYHAMSVHLRNPMGGAKAARSNEVDLSTVPIILFDAYVSILFLLVLFVASLAWMVVIAPLNYFLTLFTGVIAREELRGKVYRAVVLKEGEKNFVLTALPHEDEVPPNAVDVSIARKPFAITQAVTAAVLWSVNFAYANWL